MKKNVNFGWEDNTEAVIRPSNSILKMVISVFLTMVTGGITYYFLLPAMNFKDMKFYILLAAIAAAFVIFLYLTSNAFIRPEFTPYVKKKAKISYIFIGIIILVFLVGMLISSVVIRAKSYKNIIEIDESKSFAEDVAESDFRSVPLLDSSSAKMLADKKLGELSSVVSQYNVADYFTQINLNNRPVRVTTLQYGDIFKWMKNSRNGLPAYIVIDMISQKVDVVALPDGQRIMYSPSEHFNRNISRYVQFRYPSYMFDTPTLEIDEDGNPFWLMARLDNKIGLFGGTDAVGAVIVNAVTGEHQYYTIDVLRSDPSLRWIDKVYSSDLLVNQFNYFGQYQKGFFNSIIIQEDVRSATGGYNYLAFDDDVYLYTGVTSVNKDESIVGFVLINQRTKAANFYKVAGGQESSAQSSARGAVQEYGYEASFPLLLNISGQPTYFMSLKDSSEYVKMYAMVNVDQIQLVSTGYTLAECAENYAALLKNKGLNVKINTEHIPEGSANENNPGAETKISGIIAEIRSAVKNGETQYYIKLEDSSVYYTISASEDERVVLLNAGQKVTFSLKEDTAKQIVPVKIAE